MNYTIQLTGGEEMIKRLNMMLGMASGAFENGLNEAAEKVVEDLRARVPIGRADGGRLLQSIEIIESSPGRRVVGPGGSPGTKSNPLPPIYARYVERGASPHFPNYDDISLRVGGDRKLAYALAKSIALRGSQAQYPFMQTALMAEEIMRDTAFQVVNVIINS